MSRLAKKPIAVPKGADVQLKENSLVVKGSKGELVVPVVSGVKLQMGDNEITIQADEENQANAGLMRSLINNACEGVVNGYEKKLMLVGVGFKAQAKGANLELNLGFSHPNVMPIPKGLNVEVAEKNTQVIIKGADKQQVGQFAAAIRLLRPPEPYKQKGVRYFDEVVRKKKGKASK